MADIIENTPTPEPTPTPKVEVSPVEQKAMDQGWVPQDQWTGDPEDWRPAKEFVDRGELFKKIEDVRRENKQLRQGQEELLKHHQRVRQVAYEQALADLKAQKKAALADGDVDAVVEIDEKIDETKQVHRQTQTQQVQQAADPDPMFNNWVQRNSWYNNDTAMKAVADAVAKEAFMRGTTDKELILSKVDQEMKKAFPHKFENPRRASAPAVEGGGGKGPAKSRTDDGDMSDGERQIMNKILRVTPGYTKEQYLKEYKAIKGRGA
jgi:hypothetical protein